MDVYTTVLLDIYDEAEAIFEGFKLPSSSVFLPSAKIVLGISFPKFILLVCILENWIGKNFGGAWYWLSFYESER